MSYTTRVFKKSSKNVTGVHCSSPRQADGLRATTALGPCILGVDPVPGAARSCRAQGDNGGARSVEKQSPPRPRKALSRDHPLRLTPRTVLFL